MATRVVTTNPAGHTISVWDEDFTIWQVAEIYSEFYQDIDTFITDDTFPTGFYIRCYRDNRDYDTSDLFQIKWH